MAEAEINVNADVKKRRIGFIRDGATIAVDEQRRRLAPECDVIVDATANPANPSFIQLLDVMRGMRSWPGEPVNSLLVADPLALGGDTESFGINLKRAIRLRIALCAIDGNGMIDEIRGPWKRAHNLARTAAARAANAKNPRGGRTRDVAPQWAVDATLAWTRAGSTETEAARSMGVGRTTLRYRMMALHGMDHRTALKLHGAPDAHPRRRILCAIANMLAGGTFLVQDLPLFLDDNSAVPSVIDGPAARDLQPLLASRPTVQNDLPLRISARRHASGAPVGVLIMDDDFGGSILGVIDPTGAIARPAQQGGVRKTEESP